MSQPPTPDSWHQQQPGSWPGSPPPGPYPQGQQGYWPAGPQAPGGFGPAPAGWAGPQYPGYPPVGPPPRSGLRPWMVIVGIVGLLVILGSVAGVVLNDHGSGFASDLKEGQCVTTQDFANVHFRATSCDATDAVYEFAGVSSMGLCPDGKRPQDGAYFYASRNRDDPNAENLCFAVNLKQGSCYALSLSDKSVTHIECGQASSTANAHTAVFKIAARIDHSVDQNACATGTKAMVFTVPQRVYCLQKMVS